MKRRVLLAAVVAAVALAWIFRQPLRHASWRRTAIQGCEDGGLPGLVLEDGRPAPIPPDFLVTLEQACWWPACSKFTVSIAGDGTVEWNGRESVAVVGRARGVVPRRKVENLLLAVCSARFFGLRDDYRDDCPTFWTDLASFTITVRIAGVEKRVVHDLGCRGYPELRPLSRLEWLIEDTAGAPRWIGGSD